MDFNEAMFGVRMTSDLSRNTQIMFPEPHINSAIHRSFAANYFVGTLQLRLATLVML